MKLIDRDQLIDCLKTTEWAYSTGLSTETAVTISNIPALAYSGTYYNDVAISREPEGKISFSCPYCGTHYFARDPGFVPNCHNCGAVMCKGD